MNAFFKPNSVVLSTRSALSLVACYFFLTLGLVGLGYVGYVYLDARQYQAEQMKKLENPALVKDISQLAPRRALNEGDMLGALQVPRLGMNVIVVQGDSRATLKRAVGHLVDTALPGESGNVALAGHRDTFFRPLRGIQLGDEIRFNTLEHSFEYRVDSIEVVRPSDVGVLKSSAVHDLTLLTCYPIYYVGPAPKRLIVHAREIQKTTGGQSISKNATKVPSHDSSSDVNF